MNQNILLKTLIALIVIIEFLCCSAKVSSAQMYSLDNQISVDIMKAVMENKAYGIEYSKLRDYSPRMSVIKGSFGIESGLGYHLRHQFRPSVIAKNNPYVKITKERVENKSYERRLADRIMATSGYEVLMPADVVGMALDTCNGDYPLAMLTAHNLLKEVTYAERDKGSKACFFDISMRGGILSSNISSKLKNLRPKGDRYYGEKMGSWYHMYGLFFVGNSMSPSEAETLGSMENFARKAKWLKEYIRLFGATSPHDPFKEGINTWSSCLTYSLNRLANSGIYIPKDLNSLTQQELEALRKQLTDYHRKLGTELEMWRKVSNSGLFGDRRNAEFQFLAQKHQDLIRVMQKALSQEVNRIYAVESGTPSSATLNPFSGRPRDDSFESMAGSSESLNSVDRQTDKSSCPSSDPDCFMCGDIPCLKADECLGNFNKAANQKLRCNCTYGKPCECYCPYYEYRTGIRNQKRGLPQF